MKRVLGLLLLVSACGDDDGPKGPRDSGLVIVDPDPAKTEVVLVANTLNRDLDVLFVIDDSPTMLDKQTNLKNSFDSFVTTLSAGGLPNLHLGVITTDVGTKGTDEPNPLTNGIGSGPGSCDQYGKNGNLVNGGALVTGQYIIDADGTKNYTGELADAFDSIASVGGNGCGFEQPLHALQRALDNNAANTGFLRPTARLGIIVLTDEDDCTFRTPAMLDAAATATLGPLQSIRCTRFGVTCDVGGTTTDEMFQVGPKSGCHSNEASTYMTDIGRYTTFLRGLKTDPREVVFGAIIGNPTPVEVELRTPPGGGTAIPALAHSCTYTGANGEEVADPGVRLAQLATTLPQGSFSSVCSGNLRTPMTDIATRLKPLVGDACLNRDIAQPADCEALDIVGDNYVAVPACDANKTPPCFELVADPDVCVAGSQHLKATIVRSGTSAAEWTSVRCAL